jgi:para-nitrobenzyl esterase
MAHAGSMFVLLLLVALACSAPQHSSASALAAAAGTGPSAPASPDSLGSAVAAGSVRVEGGLLRPASGRNASIAVFRGVPFAAPPVAELRWRPPEAAASWPDVRSAADFAPSCMQRVQRRLLPWTEEYMPQGELSEDCLALNVWTLAASPAERRPVLVYIHGGAYTGGSGDVALYDGEALAARGVVVVTFNYRVGVFGFFAHPELTRESAHGASGNYGLLDQIAALRWVQRNIAAFGGDPGNVTLAGQSAGAGSVHLLTASPLARGLFQRAIAQSGAWDRRQRWPERADAEARASELARGRSLAELRALPAEALRDEALASQLPFRPIIDGWVVPDQVVNVYARGQQIDVPLLTGLTADEGSSRESYGTLDSQAFRELVAKRFPGQASALMARYAPAGDADSQGRQKQFFRDEGLVTLHAWRQLRAEHGAASDYAYFFERAIPWPEHPRYQAFHSAELPYVFDNLAVLQRPWEAVDRELAGLMASYWTNFMRSGNPNGDGLPPWPADRERVMRLGTSVRAEPMPDAGVLRLMGEAFSH